MTTDDLRTKYGIETGARQVTFYSKNDDDDYWTDDYVMWLEEQLLNQLNSK